jgi:hypothetical protein
VLRRTQNKDRSDERAVVNYYYADHERIELTPAEDLLAIEERSWAVAQVPAPIRQAVEKAARRITSEVRLLERSSLENPKVVGTLENAGVLQPVYRSQGAILVVLPEIRVEETRLARQQQLRAWLKSHAADMFVEDKNAGRLTLRPVSGDGGDALALANALAEEVGPEMVQARFVRITPRPSATRR